MTEVTGCHYNNDILSLLFIEDYSFFYKKVETRGEKARKGRVYAYGTFLSSS